METGAGLVWAFERVASGAARDYLSDRKFKEGTAPSGYLDRSFTWDTSSATTTVSSITLTRPLLATEREYTQAITSGTSGSNLYSYTYSTWSGSSQPLAVKRITKTNPTVSTGNNGSNAPTTLDTHLRLDGRVDFVVCNETTSHFS